MRDGDHDAAGGSAASAHSDHGPRQRPRVLGRTESGVGPFIMDVRWTVLHRGPCRTRDAGALSSCSSEHKL